MFKKFSLKIQVCAIVLLAATLCYESSSWKLRSWDQEDLLGKIGKIEAETERTRSRAMALKNSLSTLPEELSKHTSTSQNTIESLIYKIDKLQTTTDLEFECDYLTPEPPAEMQISRTLRCSGAIKHPCLVPYSVKLSTSGTLRQLATLFQELEQPYHALITGKLDLRPTEVSGIYSAKAILFFPYFLYAEDQSDINNFLSL